MIFTAPMRQLFAVVLGRDRRPVTEALLRVGAMQFLETSDLDEGLGAGVRALDAAQAVADITDLRRRIEGLLHTLGRVPPAPGEADLRRRATVDPEAVRGQLDEIDRRRETVRERQRALQQEILKLEDIRRQMGLYGLGLDKRRLPGKRSILVLRTGSLPTAAGASLGERLRVLPALSLSLGAEGDQSHHLVIAMKRDAQALDRLLAEVGWNDVTVGADLLAAERGVDGELGRKIETLRREQQGLQGEVTALIADQAETLADGWVALRIRELSLRIQEHFEGSARAVVFAGWVPADRQAEVDRVVRAAGEGRCYLEWLAPGDDGLLGHDVPVRLSNPGWLAPFQMLVQGFGIPPYGTIDPTGFVMPIYLAMFGLMFADAGQGLVLAILGLWGRRALRDREAQEGLRRLCGLIVWCGGASILFGVLFGSYFGLPWIRPLWFDFHGIVMGHGAAEGAVNDVYDILRITIVFGIAVITAGLVFNWVNLVRTRRWLDLVFDKGGLLGGWMYGGGIVTAVTMVTHDYKAFPSAPALWALLGVPALLLLLKEPLHHRLHGGGYGQGGTAMACMNALMEWIVELLEIFSGYLSNTLSFMRVAGLGIAHVCLMVSFFTLADMTDAVMLKVLILLLGNALVIGLEGLSAGIQALRLNYYEFFTKFFHGTGRLHTPIALNSCP